MNLMVKRMIKKIILFAVEKRRNYLLRKHFFLYNIGKNQNKYPNGHILLSYVSNGIKFAIENEKKHLWDRDKIIYLFDNANEKLNRHTMFWESVEIVRQLIKKNYLVDVVDDRYGYLVKNIGKYQYIIDEFNNLKLWKTKNNAKTLFYCTGSQYLTQNTGELLRIKDFYKRNGVSIKAQRQFVETNNDEYADLITIFGNKYQINSFSKKYRYKIRKIFLSTTQENIDISNKKYSQIKKNFLWFGGSGWIHKGLDIVIEYFLKHPELKLHIIGKNEKGIYTIYNDSLFESKNIIFHGFLDVYSTEFKYILNKCISLVYPSVSEGCSGAVIQCMHHGLIPIITNATGLEEDAPIWEIKSSEVCDIFDEIDYYVKKIINEDTENLKKLSEKVYKYVNNYHTKQNFSESLGDVFNEFIK